MEPEQERAKKPDVPVDEFPFWEGARRKFAVDSSFFFAGNLERELLAKQVTFELTDEEMVAISCLEEEEQPLWNVVCPIVGCRAKLKGLAEMEMHYVERHMATCNVCTNVFPTTRLLSLHLSESHDSFFQAKVARGFPMYECFLESCPGRFQTDARRRQHLVDLHQFPPFFFHSKKRLRQSKRHGLKMNDSQAFSQKKPLSSKFQPQRSKRDVVMTTLVPDSQPDSQKTQQQKQEGSGAATADHIDVTPMDTLAAGISRLRIPSKSKDDMPAVVSFGRSRGRGSTMPRPRQGSSKQPVSRRSSGEDRHPVND